LIEDDTPSASAGSEFVLFDTGLCQSLFELNFFKLLFFY
jgi:hypothetical protein